MNPIIDRDKICSNFVETATGISFPGSDLYPIYKNIISNKEAQKDWVTINNTFIQKSCVFDKDDPEEFKLCELFTKSDIVGINNDPDTIQSDK